MSLNDHGWGNQPGGGKRGGNQGPPDLEELWRDFNRRLSGMFGNKGGGGGDAGGFDRAATATYERLMGLGGEWEQPLAPCDRPELRLTLRRDRRFTLQLRTSCQGSRDKVTYRGTWAATGDALTLQLPKPDTGDDQIPCRLAVDKDEDVLRCQVDEELAFEARPSRR